MQRMQYQDLNQSDAFLTYPTNCLVCAIDRASDVRSLIRELNEHGYVDEDVRILFSEEGARRIDLYGLKHGWLARLYRLMETAALESKTLREYYAELTDGNFVFMIQTRNRDEGDEVWSILQRYGARRATFYGRWIVERVA